MCVCIYACASTLNFILMTCERNRANESKDLNNS